MTKLETITAEDLQNRTYEPTHFLVDELIPEGLHILAGAPKIGKSWLALWLCLCVAQGQALWNFATSHGEVLYLSLEDSFQRIQTRLFDLTEDAPSTLHFAIMADALKHGLEQQIEQFLTEHSDTKLVVIDTLQRVRSAGGDGNLYANDYQDIGLLKKLADKRHLAILLIHHLRKLHDDDPMNMISGSTGLSGAADSTFVLQKNSRLANVASLHCTGRDIPDRTLKLEFGEDDHVWKLLEDSKTCSGASKISTLQLTKLLSELLRADPEYLGSPSALSAKIDPDGHAQKGYPAGTGKRCGSKRKRGFSRDVPQQRQTVDFPQTCRKCRFFARENNRHFRPCGCAERPQRAVRRVSPLCADFRSDSECMRGATGKANVVPTCGQREKCRCNTAAQRRESPAAAEKILPSGRSQHRIWLVAGIPAPRQMLFAGSSPHPLQ